jgi:hypothetical protein
MDSLDIISKFENVIFFISELAEMLKKHLVHEWWTTCADQSIISRIRHSLLQHFLGNKS